MAHGPLYRVGFRRRREGKTDYRARLGLLKSGETRVVVRTSNRNVIVQFVAYDEVGDKVVAQAEARELIGMGYPTAGNNTPSAYLTGRLAATRAKEVGVETGVLDLGRARPQKGGVIFGALKGVVDGEVAVPHGDDVFPDESRIRAIHLKEEKAAAFAATYQKLTGSDLPEMKPAKTAKKSDKGGKAASKDAPKASGKEKKAKSPK